LREEAGEHLPTRGRGEEIERTFDVGGDLGERHVGWIERCGRKGKGKEAGDGVERAPPERPPAARLFTSIMSDDPSASSTTAPLPPPVAIFKRKSRPRPQARQKSTSPPADPFASSSASPVPSSSAVRLPTKKTVYNPLVQGTKRKKTRAEEDEEWARADMNDGLDDGVDVQWKGSGKAKAGGENYVTGGLDWDADEKEEEEKRKRQKLIDVRPSSFLPFPFAWCSSKVSCLA
jgi:hypothetical protein